MAHIRLRIPACFAQPASPSPAAERAKNLSTRMVKCLHLTMLNCKRPRLLCAYGMSRKPVRSQFFYLSVDTWMGASTKQ